jgi:hypothetical protein
MENIKYIQCKSSIYDYEEKVWDFNFQNKYLYLKKGEIFWLEYKSPFCSKIL